MLFLTCCICMLLSSSAVDSQKFSKEDGKYYRRRLLSENKDKKVEFITTEIPHEATTNTFLSGGLSTSYSNEAFVNSTPLSSVIRDIHIEQPSSYVENNNLSNTTKSSVLNHFINNLKSSPATNNSIKTVRNTSASDVWIIDDGNSTDASFGNSTRDAVLNTSTVYVSDISKVSLTSTSHLNIIKFKHKLTTEEATSANDENTEELTTLSSIFEEDIIPPLPEQWPNEDENINSYDENYYKEGNSRQSRSEDSVGGSSKEKNDTAKTFKKNIMKDKLIAKISAADQDGFQTVTGIGKAMINVPMSSKSKEKLRYVTMSHDRHWYSWEGFVEQRSGDSSNNYTDLTQIYWRGFGFADRSQKGIWIMKVGCAASIFILVATIASQSIKYRRTDTKHNQKSLFIANLATCFIVGHLVFIFGIQATNIPWACGIVSLLLHFLHLLCCSWILALSIRLLRHLQKKKLIFSILYYIPVWIATASIVLLSFLLNPSGYETKSFCWLSVEKGMLVSYIGPVCSLLLVNAGVCVACQKLLLDSVDNWDLVDRSDLKAGVILMPLEGIAWFMTIVALEDKFSYALDLAAAFCTIAVAFFILHYLALGGSNPVVLKMPCQQFEYPADDDPSALSIDDSTELALMQQISSLSGPDGGIIDEYHETLFPDESEEREVY